MMQKNTHLLGFKAELGHGVGRGEGIQPATHCSTSLSLPWTALELLWAPLELLWNPLGSLQLLWAPSDTFGAPWRSFGLLQVPLELPWAPLQWGLLPRRPSPCFPDIPISSLFFNLLQKLKMHCVYRTAFAKINKPIDAFFSRHSQSNEREY